MTPDDRLPIVLVILDGLGDRACEELDGKTPAEAATTPILDALAVRGTSGVHIPFAPGRATSSERSHWALFGYEDLTFPGRAALEGLGSGIALPVDVPLLHLALRSGDAADEAVLFADLAGRSHDGITFGLLPLRVGERILVAEGAVSHEVSDSDPLFDHLHPWLQPLPLAEAVDRAEAMRTADALKRWLRDSRELLLRHPVNRRCEDDGTTPLTVPVTKWASRLDGTTPSFDQHTGLQGGAVTSSALYRGLARLFGMTVIDQVTAGDDPAADIASRLALGERPLAEADLVHVHTKAPDEAGHRETPRRKQQMIEALDEGLADLLHLADEAIAAVTGDHATPSVSSLLHSGDPTPLVVAGPSVRPDPVETFGEDTAAGGAVGPIMARDVRPLLAGHANRPFFRGHRPGPWDSIALPTSPPPMPITN